MLPGQGRRQKPPRRSVLKHNNFNGSDTSAKRHSQPDSCSLFFFTLGRAVAPLAVSLPGVQELQGSNPGFLA